MVQPGIPESFHVLLKELQSLGLSVELLREEPETDELEEGEGELSLHEFDLALGGLDEGAAGALNGLDIAGDLLNGGGAKQAVPASTGSAEAAESGQSADSGGTEKTTTKEPTDEGSDGEAETDSATVETKEEN